MTSYIKEFILLAGYRRYNAVKKLGWKKVNANIYNEDKVISIDINDIELGDNSRKDEKSQEIVELMESIKQNGLIQPIVVARRTDLTEEDFIALNLTENVQRKDLTPLEVSIRLRRLQKLGLNEGEIAVRMGIPKVRVKNLLMIGRSFHEKQLENVSFSDDGIRPSDKGKISYTLANKIGRSRMTNQNKQSLINIASKYGFTIDKTDTVVRLVNSGMPVTKAIRESKNFTSYHPNIVTNKKLMDEICKKNKMTPFGVIYGILSGKLPSVKNLFYFGAKDFQSNN